MKQKILNRICTLAALIVPASTIGGIVIHSARNLGVERKAIDAARQHYVPISPGEAISYHARGHISPQRREMHKKMQQAYEQVMKERDLYKMHRDPYYRLANR